MPKLSLLRVSKARKRAIHFFLELIKLVIGQVGKGCASGNIIGGPALRRAFGSMLTMMWQKFVSLTPAWQLSGVPAMGQSQ